MSRDGILDLMVIGGGINGVGIARDAAGRGLSVALCERDDLASGTSSASSKMIHGGLRYLEYYEFRLVREALSEREVLLDNAPHIIEPLRVILPHDKTLRPAWMIRMGLFLYDHLSGRRRLPGSRGVNLREGPAGAPLQERLRKGFAYSDCWVDDSRLVILNAKDAAARGARIFTRSPCLSAKREDGHWEIALRDPARDGSRTLRARVLVNAAGPWIPEVMEGALKGPPFQHLIRVKGSHIVIPRLYEGSWGYILQNHDKRVIFVLPFHEQFSLIGTTEVSFQGDPGKAAIEPEEVAYLCEAVNGYFSKQIGPADVVWDFAGIRPLYNDEAENPSAITREYVLELEGAPEEPPLLSVIGGKITAYRQVAEHVLAKLKPYLPELAPPWTHSAPLPGGDMPGADFDAFWEKLRNRHAWMPEETLYRLARAYGSDCGDVLGDATSLADLGRHFGAGLYEREVRYVLKCEWAETSEDILWRRSKLGLFCSSEEAAELERWLRGSSSSGK